MGVLQIGQEAGPQPAGGTPMSAILPPLRYSVKERIRRHLRACRDAGLKTRYLIVVYLRNGRSVLQTAAVLQVDRATIYRVAARFRTQGEPGLFDRRAHNGPTKVDRLYL